ncbi:cleavage polyadenylation factor subunit SYC1 [Saccharomyces paradoxus]|uniref:Cleavage polyadenylation factor subunit SYC1 n=1 Tax=Saccharomyces paradoxus TaxID=27291 RepID=A0A8B8UZX2_SACPA|nr:Syc1 [Saccharomyces paradoxus]QHS76278.1 Syc1 [Saccharomyces paradoxus]
MDLHKERTQQRINLDSSEGDKTNDLYLHIVQMFGCIEKTTVENATELLILGDVEVKISSGSVLIEWTENSMISETIADSIVIMVLGLHASKKNVLSESRLKERNHNAWKIQELQNLFQEQFGDSFSVDEGMEKKEDVKNGSVTIGKSKATIDFSTMKLIDCNSNPLKGRVESILSIGQKLTTPLC